MNLTFRSLDEYLVTPPNADRGPAVSPLVAPTDLSLPPLPKLDVEEAPAWQWPAPPFTWRHVPAPGLDAPQACCVELANGDILAGEMLGFDPTTGTVLLRRVSEPPLAIAFATIRRLRLTTPLSPFPRVGDAPVERLPHVTCECDYRLYALDGGECGHGRTVGHVTTGFGWFLFEPTGHDAGLVRIFVPRAAHDGCEFGPSAAQIAASRWIATPNELRAALARQKTMQVRPLGQSLLELGLLMREQLTHALATGSDAVPLGQRLVADGLISRADLQTALAYKMGYPLVDLTRFPVQPAAAAALTQGVAFRCGLMPLMIDGGRLVVAVDKPSRLERLKAVRVFADVEVVAALASKTQVREALAGLSPDVWSQNEPEGLTFFETTC